MLELFSVEPWLHTTAIFWPFLAVTVGHLLPLSIRHKGRAMTQAISCRPVDGFAPKFFHVRFVVDKVALG
jgi:hypothetical protein